MSEVNEKLNAMIDLLNDVDLPKNVEERFEPQLVNLQHRIARLNKRIDQAITSTAKKAERDAKKAERKAKRREKLMATIEKLQKELEEDSDKTDDSK